MKSITYWHPFLYSMFVRLSFRGAYKQRYEAIRPLIEESGSVLDMCCGDCKIYEFLKDKKIDYMGFDFNPIFIRSAAKRGLKARIFDIHKDELPTADYVLIMGSLFQFIPNHGEVLRKLFNAARKFLIINEPVKNYTHSKSRIVSFISGILSNPGDGPKPYRFNLDTFKKAVEPFRGNITKEFLTSDGIECVVVIKK